MKALITGITGQDGSYLAEYLLEKGYEVCGIYRRSSTETFERINHLKDKLNLVSADLTDYSSVYDVIKGFGPNEVYNLAAQSFVPASWSQPLLTTQVNCLGPLTILEIIRKLNPKVKFYQASSSEMFGKVRETPQTEKTPFYPRSPYGVTKVYSYWITLNYRESYNLFASNGILFNHESPRRGKQFVTRKITHSVAKIKLGLQDSFELGNLDAKRDWGYARDYVRAMHLMLNHKQPDDFVVATGETHTVREFVTASFKAADMDIKWDGEGLKEEGKVNGKTVVKVNPKFFRPAEVDILVGDYTKAKKLLGWEPKVRFEQLAKIMVEADLENLKNE
jgi:GDPmannose 4,6-dehydratase